MIILRKQYSNKSLEQREFARWTRPFKRAIGRWRRDKAINLETRIKRLNDIPINEGPEVKKDKLDSLRDLAKDKYKTEIVKKSHPFERHNASTIIDTKGKSGNLTRQEIESRRKAGRCFPFHKELESALNNPENRSIITKSTDTLITGEAHELGHVHNRYNGTKKEKFISKLDTPERRERVTREIDGSKPRSVLTKLQDWLDNKIIQKEEKNASKNAMNILKNNIKLSDEELKEAKNVLDNSYKTYENRPKLLKAVDSRASINIPSRRGIGSDDINFGNRKKLSKNQKKYDKCREDRKTQGLS